MRSCVTRDGAICIKNVRFEYFDGTNPITGKGVSYNLLQRLWVLFVSYCCFYIVGYSYGIVCIRDWTSVVFYSWTLAINRKKLTTLLVQIERRRSHVEAAQFCWRAATCKNELVSVSSWHKWFMRKNSLIKIHFKPGFNLIKRLIYKCSHCFRVWKQ